VGSSVVGSVVVVTVTAVDGGVGVGASVGAFAGVVVVAGDVLSATFVDRC
jgi:hypothetical protein